MVKGKKWDCRTDSEEKLHFQKIYEQLSDKGLLEIAESGSLNFQEEVYKIILMEVKKRNLEKELDERIKIIE